MVWDDANGARVSLQFVDSITANQAFMTFAIMDLDLPVTLGELNSVAVAFNDWVVAGFGAAASLADCMAARWVHTSTKVRCVDPLNPLVLVTANSAPGQLVGDPMPAYVTACVSLSTGFAGRSYHGRSYPPSPTEAQNDANGGISSGYRDLLEDAYGSLIDTLPTRDGVGYHLAVASDKLGVATAVDTAVVRPRWDTQKRRIG